MTVINVNGKTYNVPDRNISVVNNKIYCNGKLYVSGYDRENDSCNITIKGDNISVKTTSGDINVNGNVIGNCKTTSGDINAKEIHNEKVISEHYNNVTGVHYLFCRKMIKKIVNFFTNR